MRWAVVLWDVVALRGSDPRQPDSTMPEEGILFYKNFSYKITKTLTCLGPVVLLICCCINKLVLLGTGRLIFQAVLKTLGSCKNKSFFIVAPKEVYRIDSKDQ